RGGGGGRGPEKEPEAVDAGGKREVVPRRAVDRREPQPLDPRVADEDPDVAVIADACSHVVAVEGPLPAVLAIAVDVDQIVLVPDTRGDICALPGGTDVGARDARAVERPPRLEVAIVRHELGAQP